MAHVKLHIPGPVEVSEKTYKALCSPMIGHRGQGFKDLYAKIQPQLQQLLSTKQLVYLSTSSAWGVMEGAIRNLVAKKVLNCMCGAFSDKWLDVSKKCGKDAEALQVDWGSPIRAAQIDARLATGQLDAVSSLSAVKIEFDALGLDVLLAGTQKAFAMPPGLAVFACSPAALAKAATVKDRGYYFDFVEFQKNAEQSMTPSTPSIGHVNALESKLEDIFSGGLGAPYAGPRGTNQVTRDWATKHGFTLFPEKGFESLTLTCVNNGARSEGRTVDVPKLQKLVKDAGYLIDGGYG